MLNNYADSGGGFSSNHGQTSRPAEATPKQHNISSSWNGYNSQLEGMYYGGEQPMYMGPYDGSSKHANYPQYPHQPVPTPVVKCQEACCQHFQDRYPLNPAPLRYQPTQPRYDDTRQYFTERRTMQPTLSRKKVYPTDNAFPGLPDRHYSQFMNRGQFMPDSRQQMQMMRSQYPMYPPYWGGGRGYGPRMNCPPPPYHQSVSQGTQLQAGLKMSDSHYLDPTQKTLGAQRHRTVGPNGGSEIIRPVPDPKRSAIDPNLQSCYEFGYPGGFVSYGDINKMAGSSVTQSNSSSCKIPSDKQYHPHQMQYPMQTSDRNMLNCSNTINDLSYSMNFPLPSGDPYLRAGVDDSQTDSRKLNLQYDSSLGKKRPDLDLRQYLATWEDDEEEGTRLSEPVTIGSNGPPYIVVDCRSLEGEAAAKIQERFKTSQNCGTKSRSGSPDGKRTEDPNRPSENSDGTSLPNEYQNQNSYAPSMPNLLNENDKGVNFWNGTERENEGTSGKSSAFQPLDCSKRDNNHDLGKRVHQAQSEIPTSKVPSSNEPGSMSFDNLVSYYGDSKRLNEGNYDFVEMTERLVNNSDKSSASNHQIPPMAMTRPCDPRLQQSQIGNNPSIYNKVAPRYSASNFQHFKPPMPPDPYYNFKHPMNPSKYFGYDSSQVIDPNFEYHKLASEFDPARLYTSKDAAKDPRRLFHTELDKAPEGAFLDPIRKAQLSDCYQDKAPCEFSNADPDQFTSPIIVKKPDIGSRDKTYLDKNTSIRERMDVINSDNQNLPEKTVLITSQNGPPEIFRVPYSPERDLSHKDNVVTLHSGDQSKNNTITVEVPYVQQYSTLVKLSEEISRAEQVDGKSKSGKSEGTSSNRSTNDETKKPTSFKLKRLPNSKEWAVESKGLREGNTRVASESDTADSEKTSSCEMLGERDHLKSSVTVSNLNMPSLDDFREEETGAENLSKTKINDTSSCASKICITTVDDSSKSNKYNSHPPQMAIVQPMKPNQCDANKSESDRSCKLPSKDCKDTQQNKAITSVNVSNSNQNSFDPEKLISSTSSHLELMSGNDISKHENFRTHKKIQSFPTRIPNCLPSPSEEFLRSQEIETESQKESYSPFHVYSDCDMNSQISEFFKMDDRNVSGEKILENRMPSSPGVEGMFEDINHSNPNNTYQPKSCDFPELTDSTISGHNSHFQSFSSIFSDDVDRRERMDGSVLQMNEKKCLNINHQSTIKSINTTENGKSDESKKSPPIPPISLKLKLNESKKMWCIANNNQHLNDSTNVHSNELSIDSRSLNHEALDQLDAAKELEKDLAQAIDEEKRKSSENFFGEVHSYTEINQLLSSGASEEVTSNLDNDILAEAILTEPNMSEFSIEKTNSGCSEGTNNKCLAIAKYSPRNKLFEKIGYYSRQNTPTTILVFDEYGTHFPLIREEAQSEAIAVVKDIIDDLISKFITDRHHIGKNNIAHVAPFCEMPTDNCQMKEVKTATSCSDKKKIIESVKHHPVSEEIGSSLAKTTELFIYNEKKYCQHNSVIKTISSVNNIVSKLKRPARSIFSPMSDHGKEDDELTERSEGKEFQTTTNPEENLLNFDNPQSSNQDDCFDLENNHEDQLMELDLSNQCDQTNESTPKTIDNEIKPKNQSVISDGCVFNVENTHEDQPMDLDVSNQCSQTNENLTLNSRNDIELENEIRISENENMEKSLNPCMVKNCVVDQSNTEIDDALELMGLSTIQSAVLNDNKCNSDNRSSKFTAENNLSYLQEPSENETDIEEQLVSEENNVQPLFMKHLSRDIQSARVTKEQTLSLSLQKENIKELGDSEHDVIKFDTKSVAVTKSSNFEALQLKDNVVNTDLDDEEQSDTCFDSKEQLTTTKIFRAVKHAENTNGDDKFHSSYEGLFNGTGQLKNTLDCSRESHTTVEDEDFTSHFSDSELMVSDGESKVEDIESRLETSVIVRNKTFNSNSSKKTFENPNTFYLHKVTFRSDSESFVHMRNIINDVINYATSKDFNLPSHNFKSQLEINNQNYQLETMKSFECSNSNQETLHSNWTKLQHYGLNYSNNLEETAGECSHEATKDSHLDMPWSSELDNKYIRTHISTGKSHSVITPMIGPPLDLTSQTKKVNRFPEKTSYCVSESIFFSEMETLFVENIKPSYFHEFKKMKWQRFHKSFFKNDGWEPKACETGDQNGQDHDVTLENICVKQNDATSKEISFPMERTSCDDEINPEMSDLNDIISYPEPESSGLLHSNINNLGHNLNKSCKNLDKEFCGDDAKKTGDEISVDNQGQELVLLKDKIHFYNQKETQSFFRRDSLKLLEREAVLREIFSPEPELDYSESKENECPDKKYHHKLESGLKPVDSEITMSSALMNSSLSGFSVQKFPIDSELQKSYPQLTEEMSDQRNISEVTIDHTKNSRLKPKNDFTASDELGISNDSTTYKSSSLESELIETHSQPAQDETLNSIGKCNEDITNDSNNLPESSEGSDGSNDFGLPNEVSIVEKNCSSTYLPTNVENENSLLERKAEVFQFQNVQNIVNERCRSVSREGSPLMSQEKEISPDEEEGERTNKSVVNGDDERKISLSFCHDTNTNNISVKHEQSKEGNAISLVTGKDVLFSTTQQSDDQDDESLNPNLHHKEICDRDVSYDEDEREDLHISSCQNDKINSVQDSLRNSHHINKETFPLQCLVEAALALEHSDSKQILLNNSNFAGLYSQSDEGFVESPLSDSPSHETSEYSTKSAASNGNFDTSDREKAKPNDLTEDSTEIISKYEETNYNLRASTRIVTSSSSNIIPYSKRKYGLKSSKSSSAVSEIKQKKAETFCSDKIKGKKRRNVFAYPRSKRRKKNNNKDKQKCDVLTGSVNQKTTEIAMDYREQNNFDKENTSVNQSEEVPSCLVKESDSINCSSNYTHFKTESQLIKSSIHLPENESKNDFGGPLLISGENTTAQGNIFCVHVDSGMEKMDDYVNTLNVGGLGILSDNNHSLFKDTNTDGIGSDIPNVSLENGTSLVIIIEDLNDSSGKMQFDDNCKSESDVMLGSIRDADCSDVLTTELSINESCICPPEIGMKGGCESELKSKLSFGRSDELLSTNCYEEINENLINDIGNWPFVEEEVAEFDNRYELPNKIPEEGRKIELKCSLPWKKIFNISKDITGKREKQKKKKNKLTRKTSGLELGPAKVEVRLKAPSAEWKVISDYHENSSPVVKVSRLILQRESDNSSSSYSEKDSEEENEHKKQPSEFIGSKTDDSPSCGSYLAENISRNENWQPIVVLKRSKELDELTSKLQSQTLSTLSNSHSSSSDEGKDEESSEDSDSDSSDTEENDQSIHSRSRESSSSCNLYENKVCLDSSKKYYQSKFSDTNENDRVPYEKYSPTGCGNSLANEKIYSPSNPHFSPGEVYPDSDLNSDGEGDKALSNHVEMDFIGEVTNTSNTETQIICNEDKIVATDNVEGPDADKSQVESCNTNIIRPQNETEVSSPCNLMQELSSETMPLTDYSSDLNETSPLKDPNSEDEIGNTTEDYKSSICSNFSSTSNDMINSCQLKREFLYDQTKKTKRKMPKNFFVRKKVRRNRSELRSSNTPPQDSEAKSFSSETLTPNFVENSSVSPSIAQNDLECRIPSLSVNNEQKSEIKLPVASKNSRLQFGCGLEGSSPTRLNESPVIARFEEKLTLRNRGRGLKRPGEGHSREDTKRRRWKLRSLSNTCQDCDVTFNNKEELTRHNAYRHANRRELHHCLLCQRSFSSAARHSLHVQGRSHRHLELTQRHTMHAMHRLLAGRDCPAIAPLSGGELRALQWRPSQPGYTHIYHDTTPLHALLQGQRSDVSEETTFSEEKMVND